MRTFKNHLIYSICTVGPHLHFYLWELILPQVPMTLKTLRWSRLNPVISSYKHLDVVHNFEHTPLATLGCKVEVHENPHQWCTYAPQSVDMWYLVPAANRYRFYTWYNIDTVGETTIDTISFLPSFVKIANFSSIDMAINAAEDLTKALKTPHPESPLKSGDSQLEAKR